MVVFLTVLYNSWLRGEEVRGILRFPGGPFYPGDIIELEMELLLPYEAEPLFPEEHPDIKGLIPFGNPLPERKLVVGKQVIWIKDYDYQAMDSLHSVVSDIIINYRLNDSLYNLSLSGVPLDVIRVPVDTTWMLRAAYQPLPPMMKWSWWPLIILLGIVLLTSSIFLFRYIRKRPVPLKMPEGADPHQWSLEQLTQIQRMIPLADEHQKEAFTRISDVLRQFIQKTTGMPALYLLTTDMMKRFIDNEHFEDIYEDLEYVMTSADMVKFAKYRPDAEMQELIVNKAIRIVRSQCWKEATGASKTEEYA
jgi:hypothetical protein